MRVFRIEHEDTGHGPYQTGRHDNPGWDAAIATRDLADAHEDHDWRPSVPMHKRRCACDSMEQLLDWFGKHVQPLLESEFVVVEYEAAGERGSFSDRWQDGVYEASQRLDIIVWRGQQVTFNPEKAHEIRRYNYEEAQAV